jgi:peptide/nickel transport system permease protein
VSASVEAPTPDPAAAAPGVRPRGSLVRVIGRLRRQPTTVGAFAVLLALFVAGALAHVLAPTGWNLINLAPRWQNHAPTFAGGHLLGTDNIGRDVLVRSLWGLHYTEQTALVGASIATVIGTAAGLLAGYYAGWGDAVLMRVADFVTGFPVIVLMIALFTYLEPVSVWKATFVFAFSMWAIAARLVRARVAALAPEEFVQAARSLGASDARILLRHLLPNAAGTVVVTATSLVGQIVLIEATTEFFGFGVNSLIRPTLGNLIAEPASSGIGTYNEFGLGWWVWAPPAVLLVAILVCVNLVGDGLDVALNPRGRQRG